MQLVEFLQAASYELLPPSYMNEIKKSLLITLDFPPDLGGVAAYYKHVCQNLPPDKIIVLAPGQSQDFAFDRRQSFGIVRDKNLAGLNRPAGRLFGKTAQRFRLLRFYRTLKLIVKHHKIQMILVGQVLPLGALALFLKKRRNIPYIFFSHGLDITLPQSSPRKKMLLKKIIASAQSIVANSYFTHDELVKLGAEPKKIAVVYPAPNLSAGHLPEEKIKDFASRHNLLGKKILLTVGRLVKRKGHDLVLKALPQIIKEAPNLVYLIAGDGPERGKLQDYVLQNGLSDHVLFLKNVNNSDLSAGYQLADVFIMPSRRLNNGDVEGFGIAYLEANAFGKPVIGGKSGGVPEAILHEKTGLLVNPTNTQDIAQAAIKLLTDEALAHRLGIQGLERVHSDFNWPIQVEKIKELLT